MIKNCPKCEKEFESTSKWGDERQFCSRKCANSRIHSDETKKKVSKRMKELGISPPHKPQDSSYKEVNICKFCGSEFVRYKIYKSIYCSRRCSNKDRTNLSDDKAVYKLRCKFRFNLSDYPDEFNFDLIRVYGWYSAKNRGNNLTGVSRDHMVSVTYGYNNGIDPNIISHPANCKLMVHNDNNKKNINCDLTIDELLNRIEEWNNKYVSLA